MLHWSIVDNGMVTNEDAWDVLKAINNGYWIWLYLFTVHAFDPGYEAVRYLHKCNAQNQFQ